MKSESNKQAVPQWINKLQENSWELELLISGGIIFSLFKLSDYFIDFSYVVKMTTAYPATDALIIVTMLGLKILTVGFSLHLITRAYWLGVICINYVFPNGIIEKNFTNKKPFKEVFKDRRNLKDDIIAIDNASGMLMFISIMASIIILGIAIFFIFLGVSALFLNNYNLGFIVNIFGILSIIYILDLFTFGILRKIKILSFILFPFFKFFDIISLRFIYNRPLVLFSTNVNKFKAVIGISFMVIISLFFTYASLYRVMHWPNIIDDREYRFNLAPMGNFLSYASYKDQLEKNNMLALKPAIQSELITSNHLMIYIPYNKRYDFNVELKKGESLSNKFNVIIDGKIYNNIDWFNYWDKENTGLGIKSYINIKDLDEGLHRLVIKFNNQTAYKGEIPFWKD